MGVSLKDIALRAGVSSVAVSLALRDDARISEARRRQVRSIADEMGYRPNPLAQAMRTRRSHTVGVLLPDLRTMTSNLKMEAIEQQMSGKGHQLLLGFTGGEGSRLLEYVASMIARQVDGLIIFGPHTNERGEGVEKSARARRVVGEPKTVWRRLRDQLDEQSPDDLPSVILVDVQSSTRGLFSQIDVNRGRAMGKAVDHVRSLGHRDLLYLGPLGGSSLLKWRGVTKAVEQAGDANIRLRYASIDSGGIFEAAKVPSRLSPTAKAAEANAAQADIFDRIARSADQFAALPPGDRPTCVLAASDFLAMTFIGRLADHGISVPNDVSVVGFDGDDLAQRVFRPRLTTLRQPQDELAEKVAHRLLQMMETKNLPATAQQVEATLAIGESTAPVSHRSKTRKELVSFG